MSHFKLDVGKFTFTVVRASGIARVTIVSPKTYIVLKIGNQVHRTRMSSRTQSPVWDETFSFTAQGAKEVAISIYRTSFLGKDVLIGKTTERLVDFEPYGKDVTKSVPVMKGRGRSVAITCCMTGTVFRCPIFAFIIGIDQYMSFEVPNLKGCINDAKSIKSFLVDNLHVPDSQIVLLTNKSATRSAIISNFKSHLINNPEIQKGDAIVIFYAGHGSRVAPPKEWMLDGAWVETICPHDERTNVDGEFIHGIPDRTVNALLHELSSVKHNNITVIFDSCHSGGITRHVSPNVHLTPRSVTTTQPIPADLDADIWSTARAASESIPAGFVHKFMASHVLLAACQQEQLAQETTSDEGYTCGFFTNSLIKRLQKTTLHRTTYSELFDLLPQMVNQNPHCEGFNKNRILFSGRVSATGQRTFALMEKDAGVFEIKAGSIHGVVVGTEFVVPDCSATISSISEPHLLVAVYVDLTSSILSSRPGDAAFIVPKEARASVSDWKNTERILKVFVEPQAQDKLADLLSSKPPENIQAVQSSLTDTNRTRSFVQVESRFKANLSINLSNEEVVFERLDPLISTYANKTTSFDSSNRLQQLPDILDGIANFNFYLGKQHGGNVLEGMVTMELYCLTGASSNGVSDMNVGNLLVNNHTIRELDEKANYGMAILNYSRHDLFPYLFYFDPFSYSIDAWYLPPSMSAPLRGQHGANPGKVTIGYGAGGGFPLELTLPPGRSSDTGFLKLFVSTTPVSLDWIAQDSLLDGVSKRHLVDREILDSACWDAWIATITVVGRSVA
ncbi:hypothetical protein BYT27DRAFT_7209205 [Phlegmacium glaucopus]|nr:hypothetical protein BYT27DRAFT_7209205 [Phlegmacium glaucopus]